MLAFEVLLNGRKVALAGADDLVVLTSMISAVGKLGRKTSGTKGRGTGYDLSLSVGGLTGRKDGIPDEHLYWSKMKRLKVGDEILVCVRRVAFADLPVEACSVERKGSERAGREEFHLVKARYLQLRRKYERSRANAESLTSQDSEKIE